MPATITLYQSTDASAPALTNAAGSLIAMLKACLVTGYGSKAAAGWTEEFTGTNKSALRMATGVGKNGVYLQIDDSSTTNTLLRGYGAMTDVDTGTEPFGSLTTASMALKTATQPWKVVATDTYFYLFLGYGGTLNSSSGTQVFFGQYNTSLSLGGKNNLLICRNSASTSGNTFGILNSGTTMSANAGHFFHCASDGINSGASGNAGSKYGSRYASVAMGSSFLDYPSFDSGALEGDTISLIDGVNISRRLGYLPGAFEGRHVYSVLAEETNYVGIGGAIFWRLPAFSSSSQGAMMIQVAGDPI